MAMARKATAESPATPVSRRRPAKARATLVAQAAVTTRRTERMPQTSLSEESQNVRGMERGGAGDVARGRR